jgi:hypothetical protein
MCPVSRCSSGLLLLELGTSLFQGDEIGPRPAWLSAKGSSCHGRARKLAIITCSSVAGPVADCGEAALMERGWPQMVAAWYVPASAQTPTYLGT